ncbi:MAG: phosphoadenylyl-sulfate reductase [Tannerellaceae bacterium]|nr:phosphoadenylyl-sulfate reductase [Tannerellaceae bacterium]
MIPKEQIDALNMQFQYSPAEEILSWFLKHYQGQIGLASSLGLEDQVLTDMICKIDDTTRIFTLDTGRLFPETYRLIERTNKRYNINIEVFFSKPESIQEYVRINGINGFYYSIEQRKQCCQVRKLEPLQRAFKGLQVWICGLRHDQSVTRQHLNLVEWDAKNGLIKLNPLINFTEADVWKYIRENKVPYNNLHDKGFPSIGCQPCTRPVQTGDDIRAGRWWWENPEHKERGLHR